MRRVTHKENWLLVVTLALLVGLVLLSGSGSAIEKPLSNADIIALTEVGLSDTVIISLVQTHQTQFDLSLLALVELKQSGVSNAVIEAMLATDTLSEPSVPSVGSPKKSAVASMQVVSEVEEAEVYLDDEYLGEVNERISVPTGTHNLKIVCGEFTVERKIKIEEGEEKQIRASLPGLLHVVYTFTDTHIWSSSLRVAIMGEKNIQFTLSTPEAPMFNFDFPRELTEEKKIYLAPGKYTLELRYAKDSHNYPRNYTLSVYPAETTILQTKMDSTGGAWFTTGISTQIYEKDKEVFHGH